MRKCSLMFLYIFGVGLVLGLLQESLFADMESVTRMIAEYRKIVQSLSESEVSGEIYIYIYICNNLLHYTIYFAHKMIFINR